MVGKTSNRDGIRIYRAWKWGTRPATAELAVWYTHPPCDEGDVTLTLDTAHGPGDSQMGYIRLTPDQQRALGEWLLEHERLCLICGAKTACMTEADLKPSDPGLPCTFDPTPRELFDAVTTLTRERDAWRREASTLAFKLEDLQHEVGTLQEQIRRIKGYINSIGG